MPNKKDDFSTRNLGSKIHAYLKSESSHILEVDLSTPIMDSLNKDRYRFDDLKPMIVGGAKELYRVFDEHAGRWVVIAMPIEAPDAEEKESFLREALLAAKLQHPAILPIYEMGIQQDGRPYFIMQLLEGTSLKELINNGVSSHELDKWISIFLRVCDAVIYAHSCGVLHLDIKPENVMIGMHGRVYLIDWGMARVLRTGSIEAGDKFDPDLLNNVSFSGTFKGTLGYMAPEQIGQAGDVGIKTDVYSLGGLLYFILTNQAPVESDLKNGLIEKTKNGDILNPRQRRPNLKIPTSLAAVAMKALSLNPADRYDNVDALRDDIIRYKNGYAPYAECAHIFKKGHLLVYRHHKLFFVVLLGSLVFLSTILFFLARVSYQQEQAEKARVNAIKNLNLYKSETERTVFLNDRIQKFLIDSLDDGDIWNVELMHKLIVQQIGMAKGDKGLVRKFEKYRAYLFFVSGKYNQALDSFEKAGFVAPFNNLYKTCEKYAELKNDDELLAPDDFAELLTFSYRNSGLRKNLLLVSYREYMKKQNYIAPEKYLPVAIAVLNVINETIGWGSEVRLEKNEKGYHLDLRKAPYQTLTLPRDVLIERDPFSDIQSILSRLNLYSLDLSNSQVRGFEGVKFNAQFSDLIMNNIKIYDQPAQIYWLSQSDAKKIFISDGMFSTFQLSKMNQKIEIILTESEKK
jgi:serine/threonine protein kinase